MLGEVHCMPPHYEFHLEAVQVGVQTTNAQLFPAREIMLGGVQT